MTIRSIKIGTCRACGKGLFRVTEPISAHRPHVCTPVFSVEDEVRAAQDLAIESGRLSSYRYGARSYLRTL